MEAIWESGLFFIQAFQGLGAWLRAPMEAVTTLGVPAFYVLLLPVVSWCLDRRSGCRLTVYLMVSIWLNETVKVMLHQPRPFWLCESCIAYGADGSFGFPSGHAQHAILVWGLLAIELRHRHAWWPAIGLLPALIGLSRIYLGVHFPTDVLGGWLVGGVLLALLVRLEHRLTAGTVGRSALTRATGGLTLGLAMMAIALVVDFSARGWTLPTAWYDGAVRLVGPSFNPFRLDFAFLAAGMVSGTLIGGSLVTHIPAGHPGGSVWRRLATLPVGLAPLALLWWVVGPRLTAADAVGIGHSVSLTAVATGFGLWLTAGAPALFARMRLGVTYANGRW